MLLVVLSWTFSGLLWKSYSSTDWHVSRIINTPPYYLWALLLLEDIGTYIWQHWILSLRVVLKKIKRNILFKTKL